MAVTKIWAIHDSVSRVVDYCTNPSKTKLSDLEQVLLYAADKEKTLDEGEQQYAVTGIGCRAESAAREMAAVQRRFGKAGGNVAYHAYQSFKTGEVTAEECHRIGVETARRLWGNDRQVLVATHFNTGTYHNHFVVNPVNMWTGKKLEAKYEVYYKLRDMSDRICKEHGLSVIVPGRDKGKSYIEHQAEQNGTSYKAKLRSAIDRLLRENKVKIASLQSAVAQLRKANLRLDGLEKMIRDMSAQLTEKKNEIAQLRENLTKMGVEVETLTEQVAVRSEQVETLNTEKIELENQLNTVYYIVGTEKELREAQIINKQGFIGRTLTVNKTDNLASFTKSDSRLLSEVPIGQKKVSVVTTHPEESYELVTDADKVVLKLLITDPVRFWESSKILIVSYK